MHQWLLPHTNPLISLQYIFLVHLEFVAVFFLIRNLLTRISYYCMDDIGVCECFVHVCVYVSIFWMCGSSMPCICVHSPLFRLFIIFLVIIKKVGVAELKINLVKRRIIIL